MAYIKWFNMCISGVHRPECLKCLFRANRHRDLVLPRPAVDGSAHGFICGALQRRSSILQSIQFKPLHPNEGHWNQVPKLQQESQSWAGKQCTEFVFNDWSSSAPTECLLVYTGQKLKSPCYRFHSFLQKRTIRKESVVNGIRWLLLNAATEGESLPIRCKL